MPQPVQDTRRYPFFRWHHQCDLFWSRRFGAAFYIAGNASGPEIEIVQPTRLIGRAAVFEATVTTPDGNVTALDVVIEQDGRQLPLYSLGTPEDGEVKDCAESQQPGRIHGFHRVA